MRQVNMHEAKTHLSRLKEVGKEDIEAMFRVVE